MEIARRPERQASCSDASLSAAVQGCRQPGNRVQFIAAITYVLILCSGVSSLRSAALPFSATDLKAPIKVPFTYFDTDRHAIDLYLDVSKLRAHLLIDQTLRLDLPPEYLPLKVVQCDDRLFLVLRRIHADTLLFGIYSSDAGLELKELPPGFEQFMFRQALRLENDQIGFILLDTLSKTNRFFLGTSSGAIDTNTSIALPNITIDDNVLMVSARDTIYVGIGQDLFRIAQTNAVWHARKTIFGPYRKMIEMASDGLRAYGLAATAVRYSEMVATNQPPIFSVFDLESGSPVPASAFPYDLITTEERLDFRNFDYSALHDLFLNYFKKGENSGLLYLGCGQSEGRISWAATYYLFALLDTLCDWNSTVHTWDFLADLKAEIKTRLDLEIALIDRLVAPANIHRYSKRYGLDRTTALMAVTSGRALQLLKRYRTQCPAPIELENFDTFAAEVKSLSGHIDEIAFATPSDPGLPVGAAFLRFKKGGPFLYDGVNLPFNQQNDWAASIMMFEPDFKRSPLSGVARSIIETFLDEASLRPLPSDFTWYFWWGRAREGWTAEQDVSVNTPFYPGHVGKPVPSYKSIDIQAMVLAQSVFPELFPPSFDKWVAAAIEGGAIYPFVMEDLLTHGRGCDLPAWLAMYYARPGGAWEMQSAVWALSFLSKMDWLRSAQLNLGLGINGQDLLIRFVTKPAHRYTLEASASLAAPEWVSFSSMVGSGKLSEFQQRSTQKMQLFRVVESQN